MERRLSSENILTYQGNVLPLRLLGGEPYSNDPIHWSCDREDCVQITRFLEHKYGGTFTDGVLLTFLKVGHATVSAEWNGTIYRCQIEVREMVHTSPSSDLQYYVGDLHDHTWNKHKVEEFEVRDPEVFPLVNYMRKMREEGKMDFGSVADHTCVLNARDFFRGYADAEDNGDVPVFFPGCEGQVTIKEKDRYEIEHMMGGEILLFNADTAHATNSWDLFFDGLKRSPFAFCGYPHPQIVGNSVPGIWDFCHRKNNSPRFRNLFRFVEMGDGSNRKSNLINEYVYSLALDEGFHVSPACSSDSHGPIWGYYRFPGKTIIMAPERSKEAFYDAILSNRMYASSSGNVKLFYTVNGKAAPATLEDEGTYRFHVELGYFRMGEPDTHPNRCRVITDRGITLMEMENMGDSFDFTVSAPDSHYFYLVLIDEKGRKTWSCPTWTGKPFEKKREKALTPIPKKTISVWDRISEKEVPELICDDPRRPWHSEHTTADLIFDLGEVTSVSALSHYPKQLTNAEIRAEGVLPEEKLKEFPSAFRIWVSTDGENYRRVAQGQFRIFGGEETIPFDKVKARYVRLEILSSVGRAWEREEFFDAKLAVAEITLWQ